MDEGALPDVALDMAGEVISAVKVLRHIANFAMGDSPGVELLAQRFSPNARLKKARDEIQMELWGELWETLHSLLSRMDAAEQASLHDRLCDDGEAAALLANYLDEAYREPRRRRKSLLMHAAAGLANLSLSVAELVRVWRVMRELDEDDVLTLYGLWLVPNRGWPAAGSAETKREEVVRLAKLDVDALRASGAIFTAAIGDVGSRATQAGLEVTRTGCLVLAGLLSFLSTRKPNFDVPGHEVDEGFRSEEEARKMLAQEPLRILRRYVNRRFENTVHFSATDISLPSGKTVLQLRMRPEDVPALQAIGSNARIEHGRPVKAIYVQNVASDPSGVQVVQLAGPFDVMRFLAYDMFARWG